MSAEKVVTQFKDPAFISQLKALPIDDALSVQQQALGQLITDPLFQESFSKNPEEAVSLVEDFANKHFPLPLTTPRPSDEQLQAPGEGDSLLENLTDPGVLLDPANIAAGVGAGAVIGKGVQGTIKEAARGGIQAGLGVGALLGPAKRGIQEGVKAFTSKGLPSADLPKTKNNLGAFESEVSPQPVTQTAEPKPPEFTPNTFSTETTKNVADAAKQEAQVIAKQETKNLKDKRLFLEVADAIEKGAIDISSMPKILQKYDLDPREFVQLYKQTISDAGRKLQQLSSLRKQMNAIGTTNPEMKDALSILDDHIDSEFPTMWNRFLHGSLTKIPGTETSVWHGWFKVEGVRRGLLVTQLGTTMRNIWSQAGRYSVEVLDQAIQGLILKQGLGNAPELVANVFHSLKSPTARKAVYARVDKTIEEFPLQQARLLAHPAGEVNMGTRVAKWLNTLNEMQEQYFRRTVFDATFRGQVRQAGLNEAEVLANPGAFSEELEPLVKKAVEAALDATFVATPKDGTVGKVITKMWATFPPLTTVNPFPRFWANSINFLMEFNPAGFLKLMGKRRDFLKAHPQERAKIISRATIGTGLLAGALAMRQSDDLRGPKWYHVKDGDQLIDTRSFAPFSTFLFMADALTAAADIGEDVLNGDTLRQALIKSGRYTRQDYVQAVLGMNRIAGTGLVFVDLLKDGTFEQTQNVLLNFIGQYLGSFSVPFRTIKDVIGGGAELVGEATDNEALTKFGQAEQRPRDTRQAPLTTPFLQNLPGSSAFLPEQASPFEQEPEVGNLRGLPSGLSRQITGLSPRTSNTFSDEFGKFGISFSKALARTGIPEINNEIHKRMAPFLDPYIPFIESSQFQELETPIKVRILEEIVSIAKSDATKQLKQERPDFAKDIELRQIPAGLRNIIIGLTGVDIRKRD